MPAADRRKWLFISLGALALVVVLGWLASGTVRAWYHRRQANAALARRDFPAASEQLRSLLRLTPSDAQALLLAAQAARRAGDLEEANRLLTQATTAKAEREALHAERLMWRIQGGDMEEAGSAFTLCRDSPGLPGVNLLLESIIVGSLRVMHLKLAHEATELWLKREKDAFSQVQGLVWRGDNAIRRGDHDGALANYREALALDPDNTQAREHAAEILARNDPPEALVHIERLRQTRPDSPALHLLLARARRNMGEHEEARRVLDDMLAENPKDVAALIERGEVELDLRQTAEAERWLRRAEALAPRQREVNMALFHCMRLAGKHAEAQKYDQAVRRIDDELQKRIDKLFTPPKK